MARMEWAHSVAVKLKNGKLQWVTYASFQKRTAHFEPRKKAIKYGIRDATTICEGLRDHGYTAVIVRYDPKITYSN